MKRKINRIRLFPNSDNNSKKVAEILKKELLANHFMIVKDDYELAISIGGDGSFLRMVKQNNFKDDIYYIGVNAGTLGFLQEIDINNTLNFVEKLNCNDFKIEELSIQKTKIITDTKTYKYNSLNEIVVRKSDFSLFQTPLYIDNELLENFAGDGLLLSTSTGSTAYNMSFGGSIIYNTLKTLIITPIAPLNNRAYRTLMNSLVVPDDKIISLNFDNKENLFFMIDGKNIFLSNVIKVESKIDKKKIKCLRMQEFHFIKVINSKILK